MTVDVEDAEAVSDGGNRGRHNAGTATAFWTGANPRISELRLGSCAAMDEHHFLMEPRFKRQPRRW